MLKKLILFTLLILGFHWSSAQVEIQLKPYFRSLKSVEVEIEGKAYNFLFDTGGGISMVSPQVIEALGKKAYGNSVGFRMSGEKVENQICDSLHLRLGGKDFYHPHVGVFDLMSLLPEGFEQLDGVISLKTFENSQITLNLQENKVIVETKKSFKQKIKKVNLVPSRFANGPSASELNIFLGFQVKQRNWWFLFDSGNIAQTKLSRTLANHWGIPEQDKEVNQWKFPIADTFISVPLFIDDIIYDGALSFDFIEQAEFFISFPEQKVWFRKE